MTRQDQPMPTIETIVSDLWRSLFETVFDALWTAVRRVCVQGVYAGRVSA
jgi:hypothetical protein